MESHDQISPSPSASESLETRPQETSRLKAFIHRSKEALQHVRDKVQEHPIVQSLEDAVILKLMDAKIGVRMTYEEAEESVGLKMIDLNVGLRMASEDVAGFSKRHFPETSEALARAVNNFQPEGGFVFFSYGRDLTSELGCGARPEAEVVLVSGWNRNVDWYTEEIAAAGITASAPYDGITVSSTVMKGHTRDSNSHLDDINLLELDFGLAGVGGGLGRYKCGSGENGFFAHATFLDYSAGLGIELKGRNP